MRVERVERFDDERLADYAGVRDPVRLRQRGAFLAEGREVLRVLLSRPAFRIRSVLGTRTTLAWLQAEGVTLPPAVPVFEIDRAALGEGSGYRFHQGCLAAVDVPEAVPVSDLAASAGRGRGPLILLEGVSNPDNVGAIFRTGAAFGATGVVLDEGCASPLYRKSVRTSMGAVLRVPFHHGGRMQDHIPVLQGAGVRVVALAPGGNRSIEDEAEDGSARALLLGSEGRGLSAVARAAADACARIPMDRALDSLNVAAAAAIALYRLGAPPAR